MAEDLQCEHPLLPPHCERLLPPEPGQRDPLPSHVGLSDEDGTRTPEEDLASAWKETTDPWKVWTVHWVFVLALKSK